MNWAKQSTTWCHRQWSCNFTTSRATDSKETSKYWTGGYPAPWAARSLRFLLPSGLWRTNGELRPDSCEASRAI